MRRTVFLSSEGLEKMREIIALYVQDEQNLRDEFGRFKTYRRIIIDFKGLVSARIIRKILKQDHPEIAEALSTRNKEHRMKSKIW